MTDRNRLKGFLLIAIALAFGLTSLNYPMGQFARAGPGLFPLTVSILLALAGTAIVVRSYFTEGHRLEFNARNIAIIMASLIGFAIVSEHLKMIAGVTFLVFCASLAASSYSWQRNLKITAGLLAVAFAFYKFLGLQLPLY